MVATNNYRSQFEAAKIQLFFGWGKVAKTGKTDGCNIFVKLASVTRHLLK